MAARLGLTATDVVDNVVTALTSNGMIAPSYWVDPHSGNNYFLTVQYTNHQLDSMTMDDFKQIPLHAKDNSNTTMLENVADIKMINTPTEVDHYQLFRKIDVYVSPKGEDLGSLASQVQKIIDDTKLPPNIRVEMRGSVKAMHQSFLSFGVGLLLAIVLVYLILMAQFASFIDPFIILLAIPSGITGVILFLLLTGTTLNVMSLMGVLMMTGIVVSNSILIVDVTRKYREGGMPIRDAVALACRVRLRPILMTSLATLLGLDPHGPGPGSRQRAVRSAGALHHRRPPGIGGADRVHCSCGLLADPSQGRGAAHRRRCRLETHDPLACCLLDARQLSLAAQSSSPMSPVPEQQSAPTQQTPPAPQTAPAAPASSPPQMQTIPGTQAPAQLPTTGSLQRLTVQDAEALALKNNPQISVYRLLALASNQVTRETKAAYYPNLYGSLTAVKPEEGSRIAAGNLNNPTCL